MPYHHQHHDHPHPQPNPFTSHPHPNPRYQTSWYINQLSQDRYGTDVPTLWNELEHLERRLQHRTAQLDRCEREGKDLRHRHRKLQASYDSVVGLYERAMGILREERERRWRSGRPRRLY